MSDNVRHLPIRPRNWRDEALCREVDPELFHPEQGQPTQPAKRVCSGCPVLAECRAWALDTPASVDTHGIAGGLSHGERRRMRRAARRVA